MKNNEKSKPSMQSRTDTDRKHPVVYLPTHFSGHITQLLKHAVQVQYELSKANATHFNY